MNKLLATQMDRGLIKAIALSLSETTITCSETSIPSQLSCPQGTITAPQLFALYVNNLIADLNNIKDTNCWGFADDLAVTANSGLKATKAIETVETWSVHNGIKLNKKKSSILEIRPDHRTRQRMT